MRRSDSRHVENIFTFGAAWNSVYPYAGMRGKHFNSGKVIRRAASRVFREDDKGGAQTGVGIYQIRSRLHISRDIPTQFRRAMPACPPCLASGTSPCYLPVKKSPQPEPLPVYCLYYEPALIINNKPERNLNNPYIAPSAQLTEVDSGDATYDPEFFTFDGRIGRVRYIAYSMGTSLIFVGGGMLLALVLPPAVGGIVAMVLALFGSIMPSIRRLNDMNQNGWLSILSMIPLLNFFFALWMLFGPGTDGSNEYGPPPSANTGGVIAAAFAVPVIGILAAVAIPAYSDYVRKAKALNGGAPRTELRAPARQAANVLPLVLQAGAGQA